MRHALVPAALEHVEEAREVGVEIGVRVLQRVAHAGLGGEMHHHLRPRGREQRRDRRPVGEVEPLEAEPGPPLQPLEPRLLQPGVVIVVEAVDPQHPAALAQQPVGQMIADEPRSPGHQDRAVLRISASGSQAPVGEGRGHQRRVQRRAHVDQDAARRQHRRQPGHAELEIGPVRHRQHQGVEPAQQLQRRQRQPVFPPARRRRRPAGRGAWPRSRSSPARARMSGTRLLRRSGTFSLTSAPEPPPGRGDLLDHRQVPGSWRQSATAMQPDLPHQINAL